MYGALLRKCKFRHAERHGRESILSLSLSLSLSLPISLTGRFYLSLSLHTEHSLSLSLPLYARSSKRRALLQMFGPLLRKCKSKHAERQGRESIFYLSLSLSKARSLSLSLSFYRECSHILYRILTERALSLLLYTECSHCIENAQAERAFFLSFYREALTLWRMHSIEKALTL